MVEAPTLGTGSKQNGKIYYISDPEPIQQPEIDANMIERILDNYADKDYAEKKLHFLMYNDQINVKQSAWTEYNDMLGKSITY